MEKLAENDLTYFYLRHVVIVVTAFTTISLTPVSNDLKIDVARYMHVMIYKILIFVWLDNLQVYPIGHTER